MANTKQARKRARQAVARNQHLSAQRTQYRTAVKSVRKAILAGDKVAAEFLKKEEFEIKLPDLRPYVSLKCPDGRRGIEVGLKGTF